MGRDVLVHVMSFVKRSFHPPHCCGHDLAVCVGYLRLRCMIVVSVRSRLLGVAVGVSAGVSLVGLVAKQLMSLECFVLAVGGLEVRMS